MVCCRHGWPNMLTLYFAPGASSMAVHIALHGIADRRLGDGWALGRYSIADIHLFRLYWRLANSLKPAPETFPNPTAHHARMMARPAVRKTIEVESAVGYELPA